MIGVLKIKENRYKVPEQLFLIIWTFYSLFSALMGPLTYSYSDYGKFFSSLSLIVSFSVIISLMMVFIVDTFYVSEWNRVKFIYLVVFLLFVFIVQVKITDRNLMLLITFVMTAQFVDFDKLLHYDIRLKIFSLSLILFMCAVGLLTNRVEVINGSYKMALGFAHPNSFGCYSLTILIEWLCIRFKKMRWYDWIGILICMVIVWEITKSRSPIYTFAIVFILFIIANYIDEFFRLKIVKIVAISAPTLLLFLSLYSVYLYSKGNKFIIELNSILTNRIRLSYQAIQQAGIKLFGQEIIFASISNEYVNGINFTVDNAYIHMALRWGIVITFFIIILYTILFVELLKMQKYNILLLSLFFIVLGFGETYLTNVVYNLSLLLLLGLPEKHDRSVNSMLEYRKNNKN